MLKWNYNISTSHLRITKLFIAIFHGKLKIQTEHKCNTPSQKPNNVILVANKAKIINPYIDR